MQLDGPLSQGELELLDDFLTSEATPEDCMDVSMLHGFLTAVAVSPSTVLPSEWLPVVWGAPQGPAFESEEDQQEISELILRLYHSILSTLDEDPPRLVPLLYREETADGAPRLEAQGWCRGFLIATYLREKEWERLFQDEENAVLIGPILAFLSEQNLAEIQAAGKRHKPSREELLSFIPLSVASIYKYWRKRGEKAEVGSRK